MEPLHRSMAPCSSPTMQTFNSTHTHKRKRNTHQQSPGPTSPSDRSEIVSSNVTSTSGQLPRTSFFKWATWTAVRHVNAPGQKRATIPLALTATKAREQRHSRRVSDNPKIPKPRRQPPSNLALRGYPGRDPQQCRCHETLLRKWVTATLIPAWGSKSTQPTHACPPPPGHASPYYLISQSSGDSDQPQDRHTSLFQDV